MTLRLPASLLLLVTGLLAGCHSESTAPAAAPQTASARIVESRQQQVDIALPATGTVHARQSATISAQVMGRILQVLVREGDTVRAGQTLAVLDDASLRSSVTQAQAGVKAAQSAQVAAESQSQLAASTLERYRQLQAQKSVSPQEMDEVSRRAEAAAAQLEAARAQTEAARAQVSGARTMLGYTRLTAPFAGAVTARMADPGAMAAPGVPILQIDQAGPLQLQASVDESSLASVRKGGKVSVSIAGAASTGTVAEILPAADPASHTFLVKIDLPQNPLIRAGMYGTASFSSGSRQAILVPRTAIVERGSLQCAYVLDARGIAQLRSLTLGSAHGDLVEVLSGVSAAEKLVDAPADRDLAGKRIEVQP
jgi:RND family efflux transporter MFP subunit